MRKPVPGPWEWREYPNANIEGETCFGIYSSSEGPVPNNYPIWPMAVKDGVYWVGRLHDEHKALILASPTMYRALKEIEDILRGEYGCDELCLIARKAIAKAEGREP